MSGLARFLNCCGITALGVVRTSSSAVAMAPFMPCVAGVSTSSAPRKASILRRSCDIDSGMTSFSRYPFAAATKASAIPVLPDVGSISTVSGLMTPDCSIAVIIAAPMRSFTLPAGLKYSSLARIVALTPRLCGRRFSRTIGVSPMASTIESNTRPRPGLELDDEADDMRNLQIEWELHQNDGSMRSGATLRNPRMRAILAKAAQNLKFFLFGCIFPLHRTRGIIAK